MDEINKLETIKEVLQNNLLVENYHERMQRQRNLRAYEKLAKPIIKEEEIVDIPF